MDRAVLVKLPGVLGARLATGNQLIVSRDAFNGVRILQSVIGIRDIADKLLALELS